MTRIARWRATRPAQIEPPRSWPAESMTDVERRARAFARVYPLLSTSIPTAEILRSYHDELAAQR